VCGWCLLTRTQCVCVCVYVCACVCVCSRFVGFVGLVFVDANHNRFVCV